MRAEPDGPVASGAAEVPGRANGQGSHLLLPCDLPAAKGIRAKSCGGEAPAEHSQTPSMLSPHHRWHGRCGVVWERGAPGLSSLLLQSDGDGHAPWEGQRQPCRSTRARLQEQERMAILPLSSPNSPSTWPRPPSLPEETGCVSCLAQACKEWSALTKEPHSRKGPQRAAAVPGHV